MEVHRRHDRSEKHSCLAVLHEGNICSQELLLIDCADVQSRNIGDPGNHIRQFEEAGNSIPKILNFGDESKYNLAVY
jgi:hypothetical protein